MLLLVDVNFERGIKMKKLYKVLFYTKKNGENTWRADVEANSVADAKSILQEMWERDGNTMHMFGIKVRLLKPDEEFLLHTPRVIFRGGVKY